jgi:hypothetical protein
MSGRCACRADPNEARKALWASIADAPPGPDRPTMLSRALASYALAYEACKSENKKAFDKYIKMTQALWKEVGGSNPTLPGFIERHVSMGVCQACAAEMSGVMDGHEIRFKQFLQVQSSQADGSANGGSNDSSGGKGAKLVPGGAASEIEAAAGPSKASGSSSRAAPASAAAARAGIVALEAEMKKGYALYEDGKCAPAAPLQPFAALCGAFTAPLCCCGSECPPCGCAPTCGSRQPSAPHMACASAAQHIHKYQESSCSALRLWPQAVQCTACT